MLSVRSLIFTATANGFFFTRSMKSSKFSFSDVLVTHLSAFMISCEKPSASSLVKLAFVSFVRDRLESLYGLDVKKKCVHNQMS